MPSRASPGESRPYQRSADGLWVLVVRDADGKRGWLYGATRAEVLGKRADWLVGKANGLTPPTGRLTVGRHLEDWLADRRGKVRPATWISYEGQCRLHLASLAKIQLVRLTPNDVRRLLREREAAGCAPSSVRYTRRILIMALGQAIRDGLVPRNVAKFVDPPRVVREQLRIWSAAEARTFLDATRHDAEGPLWTLLLGTGVRIGEGLGVRTSDVDWTSGTMTITGSIRAVDRRMRQPGELRLQRVEPKTTAGWRTMALPSFVFEALRTQREVAGARPRNVAGYLFVTHRGTPLDPRNVNRRFMAAAAKAGLARIRLHALRHTSATLQLAHGASLDDLKRALGHSSVAITSDLYGHFVAGRSRELATGMDRLLGPRDAAEVAAERPRTG